MYLFKRSPFLCLLLLLSSLFLSSFSVSYDRPIEPAQEQRLERQHQRLTQKLKRTKNSKKRFRLQQKIQHIDAQRSNQAEGSLVLSIGSMLMGIIAVGLFALSYGMVGIMVLAVAIGSIIFAIAGLVCSISVLLLMRHTENSFRGKGFAIVGLILSLGIIAIVLIGFGKAALAL